jgi:hypothetical protein
VSLVEGAMVRQGAGEGVGLRGGGGDGEVARVAL